MRNNQIRILFLGDIVGPLGREAVKRYLAYHKKSDEIDLVIANGENATHGHGLSVNHYNELIDAGVDVITSGNHFYNSPDALHRPKGFPMAIRPLNLDKSTPGQGTISIEREGVKIRVTNALGRTFINLAQSNPFYAVEDVIGEDEIHIVDFHAEATAEKRCLAEYLDGRVTAVIGTHTHVQTNDAKILNKGTFFLTDAGMNGAYDSCLGDEKDNAIYRTMTGIPAALSVPRKGRMLVNGVLMDVDVKTKEVASFKLIDETMEDGR